MEKIGRRQPLLFDLAEILGKYSVPQSERVDLVFVYIFSITHSRYLLDNHRQEQEIGGTRRNVMPDAEQRRLSGGKIYQLLRSVSFRRVVLRRRPVVGDARTLLQQLQNRYIAPLLRQPVEICRYRTVEFYALLLVQLHDGNGTECLRNIRCRPYRIGACEPSGRRVGISVSDDPRNVGSLNYRQCQSGDILPLHEFVYHSVYGASAILRAAASASR